jgi:hypothetical protein
MQCSTVARNLNRQIRGYKPKEMDVAIAELKPDLQVGVAQ